MNHPIPSNCYWTLALKWSPDENVYDLHGLWPEARLEEEVRANHAEHPRAFNRQALADIMGELESCWNSDMHAPIKTGISKDMVQKILLNADYKFWEHEWTKHGCKSGMSEREYFGCALEEYKKRKSILPAINEHHQIHFYLDKNRNDISTDLYPRSHKH